MLGGPRRGPRGQDRGFADVSDSAAGAGVQFHLGPRTGLGGRSRCAHLRRTLADTESLDQECGVRRCSQRAVRQKRPQRLLRHLWRRGSPKALRLYGAVGAVAMGDLPDDAAPCLPAAPHPPESSRIGIGRGSVRTHRPCRRGGGMESFATRSPSETIFRVASRPVRRTIILGNMQVTCRFSRIMGLRHAAGTGLQFQHLASTVI